jgi:hypothetical protein
VSTVPLKLKVDSGVVSSSSCALITAGLKAKNKAESTMIELIFFIVILFS